LKQVINDPNIEVVSAGGSRPATPPSRLDTEMFAALERAQKKMFPEAVTLPMMLTGATDSAQIRAKGVQAYGVGSLVTDAETGRVHGNDERLSIAGLGKFIEFLYAAVIDVAAAK
jgi:acetylornithine deacetylase/succinyl-diaminopimelate desuccinylase-like protein